MSLIHDPWTLVQTIHLPANYSPKRGHIYIGAPEVFKVRIYYNISSPKTNPEFLVKIGCTWASPEDWLWAYRLRWLPSLVSFSDSRLAGAHNVIRIWPEMVHELSGALKPLLKSIIRYGEVKTDLRSHTESDYVLVFDRS